MCRRHAHQPRFLSRVLQVARFDKVVEEGTADEEPRPELSPSFASSDNGLYCVGLLPRHIYVILERLPGEKGESNCILNMDRF